MAASSAAMTHYGYGSHWRGRRKVRGEGAQQPSAPPRLRVKPSFGPVPRRLRVKSSSLRPRTNHAHGALEPALAARLRELAHAADVRLALGHRDDAARVEQIEAM